MIHNDAFWQKLNQLVESSQIIIDRPKHSRHPRMPHIIYPVDYGYLENTASMDGEGIDIWVGTAQKQEIQGILCTIDLFKKDSEVKILFGCTEEEIESIYEFTNARDGMKGLLIKKP